MIRLQTAYKICHFATNKINMDPCIYLCWYDFMNSVVVFYRYIHFFNLRYCLLNLHVENVLIGIHVFFIILTKFHKSAL